MTLRSRTLVVTIFTTLLLPAPAVRAGGEKDRDDSAAAVRKAVAFYASFDRRPEADVGRGKRTLSTRFNHEKEKGQFDFQEGYDANVFRVADGRGVSGGALEALDVLPRNGRVFFPARGNLPIKAGGWGGSASLWIKTDPDKMLKTPFCDPLQITQKGANDGGLWVDFDGGKPRTMRLGAFPAVPEGGKPVAESDPKAPLVRAPNPGFKADEWHHLLMTWANADTGRADGRAALYVDGKLKGELKDFTLTLDWDPEKTGIYVAVNYIGLLDELALFDRPLTVAEAALLHREPGLLSSLKKPPADQKGPDGAKQLRELEARLERTERLSVGPDDLAGLRADLLDFLGTPAGRESAERCLWLLLRLRTRPVAPPQAPRFPFDAETARRYQRDYADWRGLPVEFTNGQGHTMVLVPPGTFDMGSPDGEPGRQSGGYDEWQHAVTLTGAFYLSKHETTMGQFRRFVEAANHVTDGEKRGGGHAHDDKAVWKHRPGTSWKKPGYAGPFTPRDDHPVVHVSHNDSKAYCRWQGEKGGLKREHFMAYDLPSEAQWEWACRAGSGSRFWWGNDLDTTGTVANVCDRSLKRTHLGWPRKFMPMDDGHAFAAPVGSYRPNAFGLCDMLGNVWEFCSTRYGLYPKGTVVDPAGGDPKRGYAVRGGGWSNEAQDARCATRNADPPDFCHSNLGFRVALPIPSRLAIRIGERE